jgi:integrase
VAVLTLSTGMRKAEVLGLRWEDVDLKKGVILLQDTKNKERRRLPVKGMALTLMVEQRVGGGLIHRSRFRGLRPGRNIISGTVGSWRWRRQKVRIFIFMTSGIRARLISR